jgi:hypothetical protein
MLGPYAPFESLVGPLQVSNGVVTGTLTPSTPYGNYYLCPTANTPLTITGTLDADNNLALTFPIAGGTGTLLATLANDPTTYAYGAWQVSGGTCAMSTTFIAIKGSPTTPYTAPTPVAITANLSGNWGAGITYNPNNFETVLLPNGTPETVYVTPPVTGFAGPLQFSNGSVTGTLNLSFGGSNGATCQHCNGSSAVFTGTLDANNNLTLTAPITGGSSTGTATITATLGSNPQTLADASFQIVGGGSCAMSATPGIITQYAPVTGTYTGTFNGSGTGNVPFAGTNITVTAVLTQSTTANASGQYPLTGTVNVTGACSESIILTPGTVQGGFIDSASIDTASGTLIGPALTGSSDPTASTILDAAFDDGTNWSSPCYRNYQGTLTRQ